MSHEIRLVKANKTWSGILMIPFDTQKMKSPYSYVLCLVLTGLKKVHQLFRHVWEGALANGRNIFPVDFFTTHEAMRYTFFYIKTTRGWPEPKKLLKIFTSLRLEIAWLLLKISQYCQKTTETWKMIIPVYSVLGWLLGLGFPSLKSCLIFLVSEHKLLVNWLLV